jgi:D-glycero-D-manno-heptose 1,7-bisphosphate phosphatase
MPDGRISQHLAGAVFMDRDGTVSEEGGYMYHAGLFRPFPWTGAAIRKINESGMKAILTTNQSGIGRGYFAEETMHQVHQLLRTELERSEARLDAIYFCPHTPEDGCECRKPRPGMLIRAAHDLEIDLSRSYMIGDRYVDVRAAHAAGVRSILVRSGDGVDEIAKYANMEGPQPHYIAENLLHAVEAILAGRVE